MLTHGDVLACLRERQSVNRFAIRGPTRQPLKDLHEIFEPDPRSEAFVRLGATGQRRKTVQDHHRDIDAVRMSDRVPETIRGEFETVRNLYLYSWLVYEFTAPAILYAHALIEKTIKEKCARSSVQCGNVAGLRRLLRLSISQGWLTNSDFEYALELTREETVTPSDSPHSIEVRSTPRYLPDDTDFCERLAEWLPKVRNMGAHGDAGLGFPGSALRQIEICASIANALFRDSASQRKETVASRTNGSMTSRRANGRKAKALQHLCS